MTSSCAQPAKKRQKVVPLHLSDEQHDVMAEWLKYHMIIYIYIKGRLKTWYKSIQTKIGKITDTKSGKYLTSSASWGITSSVSLLEWLWAWSHICSHHQQHLLLPNPWRTTTPTLMTTLHRQLGEVPSQLRCHPEPAADVDELLTTLRIQQDKNAQIQDETTNHWVFLCVYELYELLLNYVISSARHVLL